MSTPIELVDWQHELGGVLIGEGTDVQIRAIEGLGQPPLRTSDVEPPSEDGLWLGRDYYSGRVVRIDAAIRISGQPAAVLDQLAALQATPDTLAVRGYGGTTMDLRLKLPGRGARTVRGRLRKLEPDLTKMIHGFAPLDIEFTAADYLYYADQPEGITLTLGLISTGGFRAPVSAPIHVDGDGGPEGRRGRIDVSGTAPTWPVIRINGPCANPSVTHVDTGRTITVLTTLAAGEWLEIDTRPGWRTVLRNNGSTAPTSPYSRLDQFQLPPGSSELTWTATDNTNTCSLAVSWWPAYKAL
ncbi:putative mucin-2 [Streptomyces himastatinicus ATCC 53653]|uniref:Putative mucin-2 n=1 Tax=Streptomyces himastatinicus ATCC 53653 TaxID=457427 RepID=D9WWW5_9ACTN|nr:phage tail domain-containing protein [Streptomyces himastatinicus]EFL29393.1 putative mucin-2 [Streptomyces himastatinicus ATCC 53653]